MGKYLKLFETHSQYTAFTQTEDFILPNVSYCKDQTDVVHYNPFIETRLVVTYNVEDDSYPTPLYSYNTKGQVIGVDMFDKVEIDGNEVSVESLDDAEGKYLLNVGEHTVAYTLKDPTIISYAVFGGCTSLTSVTIPNSVTSIGASAFASCSNLTSITIPNSVTSIGEYAFYNTPWWNTYSADTSHHYGNIIYINDVAYKAVSTAITSCEFKNGTVSISNEAFYQCSGLESVTIPNSVTSIGNAAFASCSNLTSVTIPNSVTSIGMSTFAGCSLTNIGVVGSGASVEIPSSVTSIGESAFQGCSGLESVTIPNSVTSIDQSAFAYCTSLTSVTIDNGVTSIGREAFRECHNLTSVTIGNGVTSIGESAFAYCNNLTSITSLATTAPTIQSNTFRDVKTNGTLTVPSGSSGYDVWMGTGNYYLGLYGWTKVEQ